MVGIPGRSRGCVACRKRKKRCDRQQPACGQCQGRDTACGGYDVDRTFACQTGRGNDSARKKSLPDLDTSATSPQPLSRKQMVPVGSVLPELREAAETLSSPALSESQAEALRRHTAAKAWTLHLPLQDWLVANPKVVYTPTVFGVTDSVTPVSFSHLKCACRTLRYWVAALLVYSYLDTASGISPQDDWSTARSDRPHPRVYARWIARSASYFFQERYGLTVATTVSFPPEMALLYMSRNVSADAQYISMVATAWEKPLLGGTIRDFLASMSKNAVSPALAATRAASNDASRAASLSATREQLMARNDKRE